MWEPNSVASHSRTHINKKNPLFLNDLEIKRSMEREPKLITLVLFFISKFVINGIFSNFTLDVDDLIHFALNEGDGFFYRRLIFL